MPLGIEQNDFYFAAGAAVMALLQHPEFIYRVEIGTAIAPGVFELNQWELATRLSYLLNATGPDDALLDAAQAGLLGNADQMRAAAARLLTSDRARTAITRFHAMWLGYDGMLLNNPTLVAAMKAESEALINRVVFEQRRPWQDLFRADETFLAEDLAAHYGYPAGSNGWVKYDPSSGRQGLLSHATFLSNGLKGGDTSPTMRGIAVRKLLMCEEIAPPPPGVDAQLVASIIAGTTTHPVLPYRIQPASETSDAGRLSWRMQGGSLQPVEPFTSPRLAFQSLFTGFVPPPTQPAPTPTPAPTTPPPGPTAEELRARALQLRRRSVLDFVLGQANSLSARLGAADRRRMEQHLDEIRSLELRLAAVNSPGGGGGDVMTDLIAMAFTCDLSRVASFMITEWKCYMNVNTIVGIDSDMHELTHGAGPLSSVSDSVAWIVKQWAKLIVKLKTVTEPDGSTLLDRTALALVFEGGHGYDPEGQRGDHPHSTENMSALIAGRAGGLLPGKHVRTNRLHPAQVVLSAMNAVGYTSNTFGEISGNIPELFTP